MSRFWIRLCKLLAAAALVFLLGLVIWTFLRAARNAASPAADNASPAPAGATATPIPTMAPPVTATPAPTATPVPTPSPTPEPVRYVISLVGDCTLASYPDIRGWGVSFESVVGTDWDYPFSGTRELFLHDDLTVANLECCISDLTAWAPTTFSFLAPSEAVEILTRGGVDAATMANNHAMDFGQAVYDDTAANLDRAGIAHTGDGEGILLVTPSGLTVGLYGTYAYHNPDPDTVAAGVRELRERGAEIVVVCAHWGNEASYYKKRQSGPMRPRGHRRRSEHRRRPRPPPAADSGDVQRRRDLLQSRQLRFRRQHGPRGPGLRRGPGGDRTRHGRIAVRQRDEDLSLQHQLPRRRERLPPHAV